MLVEPVAVLVHRREDRLERVGVVVRGDPDVVDPGARCERMLGRIDAPRVRPVPEQIDDLVVERDLPVDGEVAGEERVVDVAVAQLRDQRHELVADLGEDARHLGGRISGSKSSSRMSYGSSRGSYSRCIAGAARPGARAPAGRARSSTSPSPRSTWTSTRRTRAPSPRAATRERSPPCRSRGGRGGSSRRRPSRDRATPRAARARRAAGRSPDRSAARARGAAGAPSDRRGGAPPGGIVVRWSQSSSHESALSEWMSVSRDLSCSRASAMPGD